MDLSPRIRDETQTDICRTELQKQYLSPKANAFSIDSILGQRSVKDSGIVEVHTTRDHELPATPPLADSPPSKLLFAFYMFLHLCISVLLFFNLLFDF